ncbi:hypothetical protein GQ457_09G028040 [Hibiscus cannabinus]
MSCIVTLSILLSLKVLYQLWNQKPVELSVLVSFGVGISSRSKDTIFIKFILLKYFGGTLYSVISSRPGLGCYILVSEPGLKTQTVRV